MKRNCQRCGDEFNARKLSYFICPVCRFGLQAPQAKYAPKQQELELPATIGDDLTFDEWIRTLPIPGQ